MFTYMKQLITSLIQVDPNRKPNIHEFLKVPIIVNRISSVLSESIRNAEASHTILHKQNFIYHNSSMQYLIKKCMFITKSWQIYQQNRCNNINNNNNLVIIGIQCKMITIKQFIKTTKNNIFHKYNQFRIVISYLKHLIEIIIHIQIIKNIKINNNNKYKHYKFIIDLIFHHQTHQEMKNPLIIMINNNQTNLHLIKILETNLLLKSKENKLDNKLKEMKKTITLLIIQYLQFDQYELPKLSREPQPQPQIQYKKFKSYSNNLIFYELRIQLDWNQYSLKYLFISEIRGNFSQILIFATLNVKTFLICRMTCIRIKFQQNYDHTIQTILEKTNNKNQKIMIISQKNIKIFIIDESSQQSSFHYKIQQSKNQFHKRIKQQQKATQQASKYELTYEHSSYIFLFCLI